MLTNNWMKGHCRTSFVRVMKENENLVRDTVDKKKCVVIFVIKENDEPNRFETERVDRTNIRATLMEVRSEGNNLENEVQDFR